jgi:hypothetical protein
MGEAVIKPAATAGRETGWWVLARITLMLLVAVVLLALYQQGAVAQMRTQNTGPQWVDQGAYMSYVKRLVESGYNYPGDFNRMPMYPLLQSLFYTPGMSDEQLFEEGRQRNIALSIGLLALIGLILRHYFTPLHTFNLLVITAFTVFVFKAGYFQTELLFYFLSFSMFVLMLRMLTQPSWGLAVLTGFVVGITYLTKASVVPALALFCAFFVAKTLVGWLRPSVSDAPTPHRAPVLQFAQVGLVVLLFVATVFPYIQEARARFGHYFYNVNTTFYVWYNSWDDVEHGTKKYGDREHWPDMPADEIPTMQKYLREHTPDQIWERMTDGLSHSITRACDGNSYGYCNYVLLYTGVVVGAVALNLRAYWPAIRRNVIVILFCAAYFGFYMLSYAWYVPIADGRRFVLALFLPVMFSLSLALHAPGFRERFVELFGRRVSWLTLFNLALLPVLAYDLYWILTFRVVNIMAAD